MLANLLAFPVVRERGAFSYYLATSNILSYIILELTGLSPPDCLAARVLPSLYIADADLGWWRNADGVEYGSLTPSRWPTLACSTCRGASSPPPGGSCRRSGSRSPPPSRRRTAVQPVDVRLPALACRGSLVRWRVCPWFCLQSRNLWCCRVNLLFLNRLSMPRCALEAGGQDIYIYYDNNKIGVVQRDFNPERTSSKEISCTC